MKHLNREKALEYYKALAKHLSEGLAVYLDVVDWSESDLSHNWKISLGNLPMRCPNCGRMRLNFHPDLQRIDCEKCSWYAGTSVPGDEEIQEVNLALCKVCKEDLEEVIRILWDHVEQCELYNCEDEGMNTRRILEKLGST